VKVTLAKLANLIGRCWERAEAGTINAVATKYHGPQEENLTFLFAAELRCAVKDASDKREFEKAFLSDIQAHFPGINNINRLTGLIARVNFHNRSHEGTKSGSDLGIVITRPDVQPVRFNEFKVSRAEQGLLTQAKLGSFDQRANRLVWGKLTKPQ